MTVCRHAYSLIELLAVMAILSALLGLTVGSLSPVKANALTAGGNQIADLLTSARQNSLVRHAFTAVVIKATGNARFSAFCLYELTRNDEGTCSAWTMLAPWRLLPEGIRFDPGTLTGPAANFMDMSTPPSIPSALPHGPVPREQRQPEFGRRLPSLRAGWDAHEAGAGSPSPHRGGRR